MMKFKSLFRRGQQSHLQHQQPTTGQQQPTGQQQQQVAQSGLQQRQAASVSSLEGKTDNSQGGPWPAVDRDSLAKGNISKTKSTKNTTRMQELERELELLRKERARLEVSLRETSVDAKRLHELRTELSFLKVLHLFLNISASARLLSQHTFLNNITPLLYLSLTFSCSFLQKILLIYT